MDKPRGHTKENKPVIEGQILYDFTYMQYLNIKKNNNKKKKQPEGKKVVTKNWRTGEGK